jgi:hypothetical protein
MAYDETLRSISLDADETIGIFTGVPGARGSASPNGGMQYHFVDITGPHQCGLAGAGAGGIGVLQNKPQRPGEAATVAIGGISLVVAGGPLEAGDRVSANADGEGIATTGTNAVLGRVILGAGDGELAAVLLLTS